MRNEKKKKTEMGRNFTGVILKLSNLKKII